MPLAFLPSWPAQTFPSSKPKSVDLIPALGWMRARWNSNFSCSVWPDPRAQRSWTLCRGQTVTARALKAWGRSSSEGGEAIIPVFETCSCRWVILISEPPKRSPHWKSRTFHIKSEMITGGDQVREEQRKELNKAIGKDVRSCRKTFSVPNGIYWLLRNVSELDLWFIQHISEMLIHLAYDVLLSMEALNRL